MQKVVIAEVKWLPGELGGRLLPPVGGTYYPIIRFTDISDIDGDWSAEILCTKFDSNLNSTVELSYLIDEAPFENLKSENKFKLYEGAKLVAEGMIVFDGI